MSTNTLDRFWAIVPFVAADADSLPPFLDRHKWFCEGGGHLLFKSAGASDNAIRAIIERAGCELVQERDAGICDAWNQAMDFLEDKTLAPDAYLIFLGLDDTLGEQYCRAVANPAVAGDQPDFYFGDVELRLHGRIRHQTVPIHPRLFGQDNYLFDIAHPGLMNKWATIRKFRFDTNYQLAGDFDFYVGITRNMPVSHQKIPEIQAIIGAAGMSNSIAALEIYPREWARISTTRKVKLDTPRLKIALLRLIARFPLLFNALRSAQWLIRNTQV